MDIRETGDYQAALESERRQFENCMEVHDLPGIFHYWSNRYVKPKLTPFGFADTAQMFLKYLDAQCREHANGTRRFISLGSGNCDLEIRLAADLRAAGHREFILDCVELNPAMLQRAKVAAREAGVEAHLKLTAADLNAWTPDGDYDAVMACHSLHHVVNLEGLFDGVKRSLRPSGRFLISDMIGRNGHQRWPEALAIVQEFWRKLPPSYRYHHTLNCYDEWFEDRDCSTEGFEGVRAEDILPLLLDRFQFEMFVGFANVIDPFVDRGYGPNFDSERAWDRNFIDEVQRRDEQELESGRLTPTHMMGVAGNGLRNPMPREGRQSPRFCVRTPEVVSAPKPAGSPYEWGSWPHSAEDELKIACSRMAESGAVISQRTVWALQLQKELEWRSERLSVVEKEFEDRTEWAIDLERDLSEHAQLIGKLREKSAWALKLEEERVRLEKQIRAYDALVKKLEREFEDRTAWAQQLESEVEKQKLRSAELAREMQSYFRNPLRFLKRMMKH